MIAYLFLGAFAIVLALSAIGTGLKAREQYLVTRGEIGTAGIVTLTGKSSIGRGSMPCYGSFRPGAGGRPQPSVKVQLDGDCKPGKTARAHVIDDTAYVVGDNQNFWMILAALTPFLGLCGLLLGALAVLAARHDREERTKARSAAPSDHPEDDRPSPEAPTQRPSGARRRSGR